MKDIFRYFREDYVGHSKSSAYLLALLSYYVYEGTAPGSKTKPFDAAFTNFFRQLSATDPFNVEIYAQNLVSLSLTNTQMAILSNSKIILIVFRGTEGLTKARDWFNNFQHGLIESPVEWGGPMVLMHKGFHMALDAYYEKVRAAVEARHNENQKIFVTGHSLGGALAKLCAFRLRRLEGLPIAGVYVFGTPRVGNKSFADEYNRLLEDKTFRWVKNKDFASSLPDAGPDRHVPPNTVFYKHVGKLNYIHTNGTIEMDRPNFDPGLGPSSISDHQMPNYCIAMRGRLSNDPRESETNPPYLVKDDVPAKGFF